MAYQFCPEVAERMSSAERFADELAQINACANFPPGTHMLERPSSLASTYSRTSDGLPSPPMDGMDIDPQTWVDEVLHKYCEPIPPRSQFESSGPHDPRIYGDCGNPYDWNDVDMQDLSTTCSFTSRSTMTDNTIAGHMGPSAMLPKLKTPGSSCDKLFADRPFDDPSLIPYALNVPVQQTAQHRAMVVDQADRHPPSEKISRIHFKGSSSSSQSNSSSVFDSGSGTSPEDPPDNPFGLDVKKRPESPPKTPPKGTRHKKLWGNDGLLGNPWFAATDEDLNADLSDNILPAGITPQNVASLAKEFNITTIPGTNPVTSSPAAYQLPAAPGLQLSSPTKSSSSQSPTAGRSLFRGLSKRVKRRTTEPNSVDLSPVSPQSPTKRTLAVSLSPKVQARLYLDLEMMISDSANRFLIHQHRDRRVSRSSMNKIRGKNRHQVTEFSYPQELQCELLMENRRNLEFEGICACNPVHLDSTLRNWRSIAKEMCSRTFCLPDTAIRKHLSDIYWILDMLNAPISTLREYQRLNNMIHSAMLGTREGSPAQA